MKCSRAPLALQLAGLSPLTATQRKRDNASKLGDRRLLPIELARESVDLAATG